MDQQRSDQFCAAHCMPQVVCAAHTNEPRQFGGVQTSACSSVFPALHSVLRYLHLLGVSAREIHCHLSTIYGENNVYNAGCTLSPGVFGERLGQKFLETRLGKCDPLHSCLTTLGLTGVSTKQKIKEVYGKVTSQQMINISHTTFLANPTDLNYDVHASQPNIVKFMYLGCSIEIATIKWYALFSSTE